MASQTTAGNALWLSSLSAHCSSSVAVIQGTAASRLGALATWPAYAQRSLPSLGDRRSGIPARGRMPDRQVELDALVGHTGHQAPPLAPAHLDQPVAPHRTQGAGQVRLVAAGQLGQLG